MVEQQITLQNGISLENLQGFVDAIGGEAGASTVNIRTRHRWDDAFAVDGHVEAFDQAGETVDRTHHTFRTDWPPPLAADSGPTPGGEALLAALGACIATTYIVKATMLDIEIDELDVEVAGTVDLRGLFELGSVASRFSEISVTVHVRSDADEAVLEELGQTTSRTSPVYDSLANPVPLQLHVRATR